MYNEYFGLEHTPFRLTPDTRLFYPGGGRGEVLDALVYAITSGEGIIKVVGEVGTGKTMLCRMLEDRLPDSVEIVYLANPSLTPEDILHAIALELGLEPGPSASRIQIMHSLQQTLLQRHAQNRRVVALVEEAQSMPRDTLEEIRLLSNLETKSEKLLQIVLFGQPELDENLAAPEIRQLRERITHGFNLKALNSEEIRQYMEFRLRASGYRGREAFSSKAYKVMYKASEGLTRRVNILADKSLLAAFAEDTHDVSDRHVKVAIADTRLSVPQRRGSTSPLLMAGGFVLAAVFGWVAAAWYVSNDRSSGPESAVAVNGNLQQTQQQPTGDDAEPIPVPANGNVAMLPAPSQALSAVKASPPEITEKMISTTTPISNHSVALAPNVNDVVVEKQRSTPSTVNLVKAVSDTRVSDTVAPTGSKTIIRSLQENPSGSSLSVHREAPPPALRHEQPSAAVDSSASATIQASAEDLPSPESAPSPVVFQQTSKSTPPPSQSPAVIRAPNQGAVKPTATTSQPATTPQSVSAVSGNESSPENILDRRLNRTRAWLGQVNPRHYSIQVLATAAKQRRNLQSFLQRRMRSGHIQDLYVYETTIDKRPWYGVLYGEYTEFSKAQQALRELPRSMTRHRPFIRNIRDITIKD